MSSSSVTGAGKANVPPHLRRIAAIARAGVGQFRGKFAGHPDLAGVSFGYQRRAGERVFKLDRPVPCIKVYVHRKGDPFSSSSKMPKVFDFSIGKRIFQVPVDVESVSLARLEASSIRPSPKVKGNLPHGFFSEGSIGGILKRPFAGGETFLVTALHVVERMVGNLIWNRETLRFPGIGEGVFENPFDKYYPDPDTGQLGFFDAALIRILEPELLADPTEFAWSTAPVSNVSQVERVAICGASGVKIARFEGGLPPAWPLETDLGLAYYWRLLKFELIGAPTQSGDSGAPVIAQQNGRLVGFHLARKGRFSLVLPAVDVLDKARLLLGDTGFEFANSA